MTINHTREIHCGLILTGGFVEELELCREGYDMIPETNAGNYLARRSSEDLRSTREQYHGHTVMLQAAAQGAAPGDGPGSGSRSFRPGNAEYASSMEYEEKQKDAFRGRLEMKINSLSTQR